VANDTSTAHNYSGLVFVANDIYNFGTAGGYPGIWLGCVGAGCSVTGPTVASNYIHDDATSPVGSGDGIVLLPGVSGADVRDNIIVGVDGRGVDAPTGQAGNANVIERNGVWSTSNVGLELAGNAIVRNNIIVDTTTAGIRVGAPPAVANLTLANNSVLVSGIAMTVDGPQNGVVIANNALFGATALQVSSPGATPTIAGNVGSGSVSGVTSGMTSGASTNAAFTNAKADATALDLFPKAAGPLVAAGDAASESVDDFNGTTRGSSPDVGAYAFAAAGNPGTPLAAGLKTLEPGGGDSDGGDSASAPTGSGSTIGGGGAGLPVGGNSDTSGCTAVAGSWAVSLVVAIGMIGVRRKGRLAR
jgi:hypothetical protein